MCDVACHYAADGDGAAGGMRTIAVANGVAVIACYGGDEGYAVGDGDVATSRPRIAATDARSPVTASGVDSAAADGDVAANGFI